MYLSAILIGIVWAKGNRALNKWQPSNVVRMARSHIFNMSITDIVHTLSSIWNSTAGELTARRIKLVSRVSLIDTCVPFDIKINIVFRYNGRLQLVIQGHLMIFIREFYFPSGATLDGLSRRCTCCMKDDGSCCANLTPKQWMPLNIYLTH